MVGFLWEYLPPWAERAWRSGDASTHQGFLAGVVLFFVAAALVLIWYRLFFFAMNAEYGEEFEALADRFELKRKRALLRPRLTASGGYQGGELVLRIYRRFGKTYLQADFRKGGGRYPSCVQLDGLDGGMMGWMQRRVEEHPYA